MKNIAILGLGSIARRVAKGIEYASNATLYAVSSRDLEKAKDFAEEFKALHAYGSYEDMLRDSSIDMVYICTPNYLHFEQIMLCLSYGKHVMCEKPLVSNMEQLKTCFQEATRRNCFLMEAEKTLFTPLNQKIKAMIAEGVLGDIQYIEGSYACAMDVSAMGNDHWCFRKEDGGSTFDVGVYPICYANYFSNSVIQEIQAVKEVAKAGYDIFAQISIRYENGVMASVRSGWKQPLLNIGYIYGTKGYITSENFWKNTVAHLHIDGQQQKIEVEQKSDFTGEVEHAVSCIEQGLLQSPILHEDASIEIMKVLEYVKKKECM